MKKIFASVALVLVLLLLIVVPAIILTGCAKLVSTEYEDVDVTIVDEYHRGAYSMPIRVGKVTTIRHVPAVYQIHVEYGGVQYSFSAYDTWATYRYMIGYTVPATMEIKTYDDDTVKYNIVSLGEEKQYG